MVPMHVPFEEMAQAHGDAQEYFRERALPSIAQLTLSLETFHHREWSKEPTSRSSRQQDSEITFTFRTQLTLAMKWFHCANGYQVWPASFKDSNSDGVGDIQGIISKLSYLKDTLLTDMLWLSPIYDSPQKDMGYDVANYEEIYPKYGTLDDFDQLVEGCKARGIKVVMDLVANHTSDQHKWFLESKQSREGSFADWYHWRDPRYDSEGNRRPPNNWRRGSTHGKSCWTFVPERDQYYFHFGTPYQPNLNWSNSEVREAVYKSAIEFWLRRGVDGFRIDVVNLWCKDLDFPDAPIVYPGADLQPLVGQYCLNLPDVHVWLKELRRRILKEFGDDIVLVGELPGTSRQEFLKYIQPERQELDMALDTDIFIAGNSSTTSLHEMKRPELPLLKDAVLKTQSLLDHDGWPTVFLENHDFARSLSRFGPGDGPFREAAAKMLALLATTLSGLVIVFQGQEIGMVNVPMDWGRDEFRDRYDLDQIDDESVEETKKASEQALATWGRDNGRLPMQWDGNEDHAGFSDGQPWIRVNDDWPRINVASQIGQHDSVLEFWSFLMAARKESECKELLMRGKFRLLDRDGLRVFSYLKIATTMEPDQLLVVLSFSSDELEMALAEPPLSRRWKLLVSTYVSLSDDETEGKVRLRAWEGRLYQAVPADTC